MSRLKRGIIYLFILFLIAVIIIGLYVNYKKNDISKDFLLLVNKEIKGDLSVKSVSLGSLFSYPEIDISLQGLQFHSAAPSSTNGELIIDLPKVKLNTDLSKLFSKKVLINTLTIENAVLYLERDSTGTVIISEAFEPLANEPFKNDSSSISIHIAKIDLLKTEIVIKDGPSRSTYPFNIESIYGNFTLKEKKITGWANSTLKPLQFDETESLLINNLPIELKTNYSVHLVDKIVDVSVKELKIGDELYQGTFAYNFMDESSMNIELQSNEEGIKLENLFTEKIDSLDNNSSLDLSGIGHFKSSLSWKPELEGSFLQNVDVSLKLEGRDLKIEGIDLDAIIEKFKRSQNFNLVDMSAVMFAGPAGLAITKGSDFASLAFVKAGDSSKVNHFLAEWKLQKGQLETKDVALSTSKNRITMGGWYKVEPDSLDFSINIVDKRGCNLAGQKIYGEAKNPQYSKVKLLQTFFGPVKNFFRNIGFSNCMIIYEGQIEHPVKN